MKTRLFTIVWGDRHVNWFERGCVASLSQPKNLAALHEHVAVWDIATRDEDHERLSKIANRLDLPFQFHPCQHTLAHGPALQMGLIDAMKRCLEDESAFFVAPPDTIFGDGSVRHIINCAAAKDICIAVPHVRSTPKVLDIPGHARSNAALVSAAFKHLHRTWIECEATKPMTNTWGGGTSWRKIDEGMYAVTHYLPTVYLAKFKHTDLQWFTAYDKCDAWDHAWPSKLCAEARQRVIGSSDAAFMVELTQEFSNIPQATPTNMDEPDAHWGHAAHNLFNKNHLSIFRAEE